MSCEKKNHRLIKVGSKEYIWDDPDNDGNHYCATCHMFLCGDCVESGHRMAGAYCLACGQYDGTDDFGKVKTHLHLS